MKYWCSQNSFFSLQFSWLAITSLKFSLYPLTNSILREKFLDCFEVVKSLSSEDTMHFFLHCHFSNWIRNLCSNEILSTDRSYPYRKLWFTFNGSISYNLNILKEVLEKKNLENDLLPWLISSLYVNLLW